QRDSDVRRRGRSFWVERTARRAVARSLACALVASRLRRTGRLHGRGRKHPLHHHARREIPQDAVRRHRRPRPEFQRPRTKRIPAHPDRQARHASRRASARRPLPEEIAIPMKKILLWLMIAASLAACSRPAAAPPPQGKLAFPGALGWAATTAGGRG